MDLALFEKMQVREVVLRNRIVVAPMLTYASQDGFVGDWHLVHLGRFAAGGAGLVMMEATAVEAIGRTTDNDAGIWDDAFVAPMARITSFIKTLGGAAGLQLNHAGRKRKNVLPWDDVTGPAAYGDGELIGPSAIPHASGFPIPREASTKEIHNLIQAWGEAARRAHIAGFDILELHAAHGYLLHQFLSPAVNQRQDAYGGRRQNRMRFVIEVAEYVRRFWPAEKPLFVRLSCVDGAGWEIEDSIALARELAAVGVDLIDCSSGGISSHVLEARQIPYGYQVPFAERIRADAQIRTMAVGLIVHPDQAESILREGSADLVALGREYLHNPNWPMDAAQKLGLLPGGPGIPAAFSFWLDKRAVNNAEIVPSTWRGGSDPRRTQEFGVPDGRTIR